MESFEESLAFLIRNKSKRIISGIGTVQSITGETCVLSREGLSELKDVRLNAFIKDYEDKLVIYPAVGSEVFYLQQENNDLNYCIVQYTKIDKVRIQIGGASFEMSAGKFEFKNNDADLKEILTDTLNRLKNAIITTPSGPGKFSETDKLFFENQKTKTENLFK